MRKPWSWFAVSALLLGAPAAWAATVLERTVQVEIQPDGSVVERERLRVRLEEPGDFASWSPYPIVLDENRQLESVAASVTHPDGRTEEVKRRGLDTHEVAGSGNLHSSLKFRSVSFPPAPVGSVLAVEHAVRVRPWFPTGSIALGSSTPTESLRVEVKGGGPGWRWRLDGSLPGVEAREIPGGVAVTGRSLPRLEPPQMAPALASSGAVLRFAWGDAGGWEEVGSWFDRLAAEVPRGAAPVRDKARELTAGLSGRRERLEALLEFARRQVRYVSVQVGIGGYRPDAPADVLARRWGDCKGKSFLLLDLLRAAGIEAWPVLILSGEDGRVDRELPSPFQFNHLIVAVSAQGLELEEEAPVAAGLLFLDPTQTVGGLSWLHPGNQDQEALVIRGGRGELVRTPIRPQSEAWHLSLDLALAASGEVTGEARLAVRGKAGWELVELQQTGRPDEIERAVLRQLGAHLPGVRLEQPKLAASGSGVPAATLTARLHTVLQHRFEDGSFPQLPIPPLAGLPAPRVLDGRELPVVAAPALGRLSWSLALPMGGCPPAPGQDLAVENELGSFRQSLKLEGGKLVLERRSELRRRWIEPVELPALKELSLAEHRTNKRRLRLQCPP